MGGRREGRREGQGEKGSVEENLREHGIRDVGRTEMRAWKDILIEGAIMELARNLALEKFPGIHRMTPAKTLSNRGDGAKLALPCSQIELMNILNITVESSSSN